MKNSGFIAFAALIYVTDTEEESVMRFFDWKTKRFSNDRQIYYETKMIRDKKEILIVAAKQPEMGMTAAATLSMKLIEHYRPQYLIMPGIAAGINKHDIKDKEQMYGDVVLATSVWNCSNGKYVSPEEAEFRFGDIGFIPRPTIVDMEPELIRIIKLAAESKDHECFVDIGAMASGMAVVANIRVLKSVHSQAFNTRGMDMESYAVSYAAREATEPRPYAIIAKGICDFADSRKNDQYQRFASYTSCEFTRYLIEKVLPDRCAGQYVHQ